MPDAGIVPLLFCPANRKICLRQDLCILSQADRLFLSLNNLYRQIFDGRLKLQKFRKQAVRFHYDSAFAIMRAQPADPEYF